MRGEFQRWNTHHSHIVPIDVCGQPLNIAQDPSSDNLGTTIWDASVILVRYMERNPHLYSRRKLEGKRVLELGAGCGLAGMYFALQGAHVTFTDLAEVVPLLRRNVTMNLGGNTANSCDNCHDGGGNESKGTAASKRPKIEVLDYCWGDPVDALSPPYDYVIACDCVYAERLVDSLVWSLTRVSARGTTVIIASEKREEITYAKFRSRLGEVFTVRQAPRRHMDAAYDHDMSEVLLCKLRRAIGGSKGTDNRVFLPEDSDEQTATEGGCTRDHPIVPNDKSRERFLEVSEGKSSETATIENGVAVVADRHSVLDTDSLARKELSSMSVDADETPDAKPRADLLEGVATELVGGGAEKLSLARVSLATPSAEGIRHDPHEIDLGHAVTSVARGNGAR